MEVTPALAFGGEKGERKAQHQRPVKNTGRQIPYQYALFLCGIGRQWS
jgi:hypothetical protein